MCAMIEVDCYADSVSDLDCYADSVSDLAGLH